MAGGKDQKDANAMLRQQQARSNAGTDAFSAQNLQDQEAARQRSGDLYNSLRAGYGNLAGQKIQTAGGPAGAIQSATVGGAIAPAARPGIGGGGGEANPPPGKSNLPNEDRNALMEESLGGFREFSKTGGWDPNRVASMDQNIAGLKEFGKTGGLDAEAIQRMRGNGVYDEFAKTGGLSEQDRTNMRTRANSVIPSMFGSMRDQAARQGAVQGGYGPGQMALMSRLGRNQAGAAADTALNTELGITGAVNQGRQWGAGGMTSAEGQLQGLRTGNQLAGMTGAADVESGMVNSIAQGRMAGFGGISQQGQSDRQAQMDAARSRADIAHQNQMAGIAGSSVSNSQANFERQFAADQEWRGLSGLESLYGGAGSGEYNQQRALDLQNRGMGVSQGMEGATALKTGNKSWADYAAPIAGAVAGGLTGGASIVATQALKKKAR